VSDKEPSERTTVNCSFPNQFLGLENVTDIFSVVILIAWLPRIFQVNSCFELSISSIKLYQSKKSTLIL
jgi:hypothetical protein